jgi:putative ABC transport system substrate-binding protein
MRRREFIAGLGSAAAWPVVVRAQQGDRVRRVGVLIELDENDPLWKARHSAFTQGLADLGWTDGRNLTMDLRWGAGESNRIRAIAHELVGLQPDIIVTASTAGTIFLQRETQTIPIVFASVSDPVETGIVRRLDRPEANTTGFVNSEASLGGKWLELSRRSRPASSGPPSCSIPTRSTHRFIGPHLRRRPGHSRSIQSLRSFVAT